MAVKLIILRGNSGSGKSTTAKALQHELGYGTMLIPQDVVRREIMRCKDTPGNPSTSLIDIMVRFGWSANYTVIVEGILNSNISGDMLKKLLADCPGKSVVAYFLLPFEETLRRHATKSNAHEFGEAEMRRWWRDDDRLGVEDEIIIDKTKTSEEVVAMLQAAVVANS